MPDFALAYFHDSTNIYSMNKISKTLATVANGKPFLLAIWEFLKSIRRCSPIGLSILCDIESNMCCTKSRIWTIFRKVATVTSSFGSQRVLKVPLRIRDKTNTIFQVYLLSLQNLFPTKSYTGAASITFGGKRVL